MDIESKITTALDERDAAQAELDAIVAAADGESRDLTEDEDAKFTAAKAKLDELDEQIGGLKQRKADLDDIAARKAAADEARKEIGVPRVTVKSEERTYRADRPFDFFQDAYRARFLSDFEAAQRVQRSQRESADAIATAEARSTTGAMAGLVVPGYLTDRFAPTLVSGRPFLSNVTNLPLPSDGMVFYVPKGNTATSVAAQATQNSAVSNTTYAATDVTVNVNTYAGQNVLSRQSFERGTQNGQIILSDLYQQYATKVNVDALGGAGTSGTHKGILSVTNGSTAVAFTGTTQSAFLQKVIKAIGLINQTRYVPADLIVMHPRRWAWLTGGLDSNNRPLVEINTGGQNTFGGGDVAGYGTVGSIAGVRVITDGGVSTAYGASTDQDQVVVTRSEDILFWEDSRAPVGFTFEEVLGDQLSVRLVIYGYSAFTAERYPQAIATVTGSGMTNVL